MDLIDFSRYFAALLVVLGLLGGVAVILRKGWLPSGLASFQGLDRRERRLAVKESLILDPRRRIVIVKSDDVEHVLLLGPERETVLETRPVKAAPVFTPIAPADLEDESAADAGDGQDGARDEESAEKSSLRAAE
ncbi:flagellar biosynthetic protein FliO [Maricaulaceae bacterium MS644]